MNTIEEAAEKYAIDKGYPKSDKKVFETTYWIQHNIALDAFKAGQQFQQSEIKDIDADTPLLQECFADNGSHSHWELVDTRTGKVLWEEPEETQSQQPEIDLPGDLILADKSMLIKKVMFYREQTEKIRAFIHDNKIGNPTQGFFDVILEHLQSQQPKEADGWTDELVKEMIYSKLPVPDHYIANVQKCLDEFKKSKNENK